MPKKTKLLPLAPPDHDTNAQGYLAATQTPSEMKSGEIENISRASMARGEVKAIRKTDPMVILGEKGRSSRNLLIRSEPYDTVQQRTILPIQSIKAYDMEMRKRIMVRMPNRDGEEQGSIIKPDSSSGIYFTASVEAECRFISQNQNMKQEEKIKVIKANAMKRAACMNQRIKSFAKICKAIYKL